VNEFSYPYYAAKTVPKDLPQTQAEKRPREVLSNQAARTVSRAVKRWRDPLRRAVRDATALTFIDDSGQAVANVSIEVVNGLPLPFADASSEIEPWQWWLILKPATIGAGERRFEVGSG
jgi:hypothetical protein